MADGKVLVEDGSPAKKLIIQLREYEGHRLLDVRYWYTDKKDKLLKPTQKGINLTRSNYLTFKSVITNRHEEVMDWLGVGYVPEHVDDYTKKQHQCANEQKYTVGKYDVSLCDFGSSTMLYDVTHLAGQIQIKLNTEHKFIKGISKQLEHNSEVIEIVCDILIAFDNAKNGLGGSHSVNADALIEGLEYDWSHSLNAMSGKKK